jgi:hypothetical protein
MRRGAIALASVCALATPSPALAGSLYDGPGPRPGPDILYAPPVDAPQLQNTGIWQAPPILVSGASAYRAGEFLYQDFLYDDHGARALQRDGGDQRTAPGGQAADGDLFAAPNGTYTYPTDPRYAGNAADLVELRVKPLPDATAFRLTLNTLEDPELVAATIALGGAAGHPVKWPHGANVQAPGALFLTVHGGSADLVDANGNPTAGGTPSVAIDMLRRQIEVRVAHAAWDPSGKVERLAAGVGLWDRAKQRYLLPQANADATHPGGAIGLSAPAAFFNLAFRGGEPLPRVADAGNEAGDAVWWRDHAQGHALAAGDISAFFADVDFARLAAGTGDESGVPQSGPLDRILASRFETKQGVDYSVACGNAQSCKGELRGQLQPYAIYVPRKPAPAQGFGLTLLLHSLSASYNQFLGTQNQSEFGERGPGSIVVTPSGRGLDGWYYDQAGADTFEVWADVARHYALDPDYSAIAGYSMGGYGTYKFATQFPDLFARAQPTVGPPGLGIWVPPLPPTGGASTNTIDQVASLRNVPVRMWVEATDELVPIVGTQAQARALDALGYRYEFDMFAVGEHLTLAINDQFQPSADFLGTAKVDRNPSHVTYVYNPTMDFAADGTRAGHAYWVADVKLRQGSGLLPHGLIDVRSEGFGTGDPAPSGTQLRAGLLAGGAIGAIPYTSQSQTWGPAPAAPRANRLDILAHNVARATIDAGRARVDCNAALNVVSDGPLAVDLTDCPQKASSAGGCASSRVLRVRLPHARGTRVLSVTVKTGHRRLRVQLGRALRHRVLRIKAPPGAVRVTVRMRVHGRKVTERRNYRVC